MKIVSQLDADGIFVAPVVADPSPLEPGVFLIPAGAVDAPPPSVPQGQRARWLGFWSIEPIPEPEPEPDPEPPVPTIPRQVSRAQGKAALIQSGLWPQVLAFVASIPDPIQRALAEVALHDTQFWQRNSPFLNAAAQALGMTSTQMDELFTAASQIEL